MPCDINYSIVVSIRKIIDNVGIYTKDMTELQCCRTYTPIWIGCCHIYAILSNIFNVKAIKTKRATLYPFFHYIPYFGF